MTALVPHRTLMDRDSIVSVVMDMWKHGKDTRDMSIELMQPEAHCMWALRIGRDRQRQDDDAGERW